MYPLISAKTLSVIDGGSNKNPKDRYGKVDNYNSALLDLSNVCYVLSVKKDGKDIPSSDGRVGTRFRLPKLKTVFSDKSVAVLQNTSCLPRTFLVRRYSSVSNEEEVYKIIQDKNFNPGKIIVLEEDPKLSLKDIPIGKGEIIRLITHKSGFEEIKVVQKEPSFLFVSDTYYPGWKAFIDGKETKIYKTDYAFQSFY